MARTVPDVAYWSVSAARKYATEHGFTVEVVGDGNVVYGQSPAAGVKVASARARLSLYTERRAGRTTVTVPNLLGRTAVSANETLAARQLNIRIQGTNNYLSGTGAVAIAQDPPAGTEVEIGTVVTVTFRSREDPE